jgi:glutathione synthase/RimK-type ligase-like ATP-grasp enzyme
MRKINLVILANEMKSDHQLWVNACEKRSGEVNYHVVDLTRNDWYERITEKPVDYLLVKPGGFTSRFKHLYDERLSILTKYKNYKSFPTIDEVLIHENKIFQSYWLKAHNLPHPETNVFYYKEEADDFIKTVKFPVVVKLNIGASGKGVTIINNEQYLIRYTDKIFSGGQRSRTGPDLKKGHWLQRAWKVFTHSGLLKEKIIKYKSIYREIQSGILMLQEYIPHEFEWRAVRIGDSFFAHKKLKIKDKASGSLIKKYDPPPVELLTFAKQVTDRFKFYSMSMDIFERGQNAYLINEMQCIFGQSDPYQMLVNGKPGRYIFSNNNWMFEEGDFNTNQCFDLRLDWIISTLAQKK